MLERGNGREEEREQQAAEETSASMEKEEAEEAKADSLDDRDSLRKVLEEERIAAEESRKLAQEYLESLKRLKADFENFRKREMAYRQNFVQSSNRELILKLLSPLDDLEKALQEKNKQDVDSSFLNGVDLIYRKLLLLLKNEGVTPIKAVGEKFDPEFHEALMTVSLPDHEDYEVVEEIRRGYRYNDEVLRPSQVKVNRISEEQLA